MHRKPIVFLLAAITTLALSSCDVDVDRVQKDIKDLGQAVADKIDNETTATVAETSEIAETSETTESTEVTETTEVTEPEVTETSETTAVEEPEETEDVTEVPEITEEITPEITPEVTPEPAVERVDFSSLIDVELTTNVIIKNEAFREVFEVEEETQYAEFSGNRSFIEIESAPNVANAVNLIVDGFYQEASGDYSRIVLEKQAELALDANAEIVFTSASVVNDMTTNGRIISVRMSYSVEEDEEIIEYREEIYSFDLLTGQLITINMLTDDPDGLKEIMLKSFDEELDVVEVIPVFVATTEDYTPIRLIGITSEGERVTTMLDITDLGDQFNRFGRTICLI